MSFRKHLWLGGLWEPPHGATPGLDAAVTPAGICALPAPWAAQPKPPKIIREPSADASPNRVDTREKKGVLFRRAASRGKKHTL